ncbi:hypothetical protein QVD99_000129 [Batrachochytrium dendrobatidis]|nr:hypothetical protein QVD99_000129 [Batrachochytrium dendrobatidis]
MNTVDIELLSVITTTTMEILDNLHSCVSDHCMQQSQLKQLVLGLSLKQVLQWSLWFESICLAKLSVLISTQTKHYQNNSSSSDDSDVLLHHIKHFLDECIAGFDRYSQLAHVLPNGTQVFIARLRIAYLAQVQHAITTQFKNDVAHQFDRLIQSALPHSTNMVQDRSQIEQDRFEILQHPCIHELETLCNLLQQAGLSSCFQDIYNSVLTRHIKQHVVTLARHLEYVSVSNQLQQWLKSHILHLSHILGELDSNQHAPSREKKLEFFAFQTLCVTRVQDAFEIVRDFPDSVPAVEDLYIALQKYNNIGALLKTLETSIGKRLIHCGAFTQDILSFYIALAQVLCMLECSEDIVNGMLNPIRLYLRSRGDSLEQIITQLVNQDTEVIPLVDHAVSQRLSAVRIPQLLNIFPNKEVYAKTYIDLLATRLLSMHDFDLDDDKASLAMLERRIGNKITTCAQVMIKDMQESRRFAMQFHKQTIDASYFSVLVISARFWPDEKIRDAPLTLPHSIQQFQKVYQDSYALLKARRLKWRPMLGSVDIEIGQGDSSLRVSATPAQATLVSLFSNKDSILVSEAIEATQLSKTAMYQAVGFWNHHGVLALRQDHIINIHNTVKELTQDKLAATSVTTPMQDVIPVQDPAAERLETLQNTVWPFVEAAMTAFDRLTVHDIQKQLAPFGLGMDEMELRKLLEWAIECGKADKVGQHYVPKLA